MNLEDEESLRELQGIFNGSDDRVLVAEGVLGEDAAEFVRSDLGRYIMGRANQEIQEAVMALKKVYPWRRNRISQLQNQIAVAESAKQWLLEAIVSGRTAIAALERRAQTGEE